MQRKSARTRHLTVRQHQQLTFEEVIECLESQRAKFKADTRHKLMAQFTLGARSPNQREQANRYGRAVNHLRHKGEPIDGIAERLANFGGIKAVLRDAKLETLGGLVEKDVGDAL